MLAGHNIVNTANIATAKVLAALVRQRPKPLISSLDGFPSEIGLRSLQGSLREPSAPAFLQNPRRQYRFALQDLRQEHFGVIRLGAIPIAVVGSQQLSSPQRRLSEPIDHYRSVLCLRQRERQARCRSGEVALLESQHAASLVFWIFRDQETATGRRDESDGPSAPVHGIPANV